MPLTACERGESPHPTHTPFSLCLCVLFPVRRFREECGRVVVRITRVGGGKRWLTTKKMQSRVPEENNACRTLPSQNCRIPPHLVFSATHPGVGNPKVLRKNFNLGFSAANALGLVLLVGSLKHRRVA